MYRNKKLQKKVEINTLNFFNSTIFAEFIINKTFNVNKNIFKKIRFKCSLHMKNIVIFTGNAGFIGSNLIEYLFKKTNLKIASIDNYSSYSKKNYGFKRIIIGSK